MNYEWHLEQLQHEYDECGQLVAAFTSIKARLQFTYDFSSL